MLTNKQHVDKIIYQAISFLTFFGYFGGFLLGFFQGYVAIFSNINIA
jgi:hypothetical protein